MNDEIKVTAIILKYATSGDVSLVDAVVGKGYFSYQGKHGAEIAFASRVALGKREANEKLRSLFKKKRESLQKQLDALNDAEKMCLFAIDGFNIKD